MPGVPPFLLKTYEIISKPEYVEICSWGENNDTVFIKNIEEFARIVLPKYFKHSNYASFTRQLHKYDFHKTMHNPRHGEFKHQYFVKGKPELLELIQRKIYVSKSTIPISDSSHTDGETDISSDKASVTEKDHDIDMDGIDELHGFEMDFDQFDEIEASVEHGIIDFDNERITVLEKRQAELMDDNESTKKEILDTLKTNESMTKVIDCMLSHAASSPPESRPAIENFDNMDNLCEMMRGQCSLGLPDEVKNRTKEIM